MTPVQSSYFVQQRLEGVGARRSRVLLWQFGGDLGSVEEFELVKSAVRGLSFFYFQSASRLLLQEESEKMFTVP